MMDKRDILDQGILELYVLGELNDSEQFQVEKALSQHKELRAELSKIESNLEQLAFENQIEPDAKVKSNLLNSIAKSRVVNLDSKKEGKLNRFFIAASIAALLCVASVYFFSQWNTSQNQLKLVKEQNQLLDEKLKTLTKDLEDTKTWYSAINDPDTRKYILKGNDLMPEAKLISYVNATEKTVFVNSAYLPKLDDKHDYQMWADVNGEMVNMGVIDTNKTMLAMTYIENPESLNITIEPAGGSKHPTVSKLITNVYLK